MVKKVMRSYERIFEMQIIEYTNHPKFNYNTIYKYISFLIENGCYATGNENGCNGINKNKTFIDIPFGINLNNILMYKLPPYIRLKIMH